MDIKTLIFDFGQVVGHFDHRLTTKRLAAFTELPADELHAQLFGSSLEDDYESGRLSTPGFLRILRETCRLTCPDEVLAAAWADIFWPNPDVCSLIPRVKAHHSLLLASNTNQLHAQQFCTQFADTLRHFDAIVLSHKIGVRKPRAAFFEHCQELGQCAAEECLFIDDLPANVAGAEAYGFHAICYSGIDDLLVSLDAFGIKGLRAGENAGLR
jgi:FMN phosphatase YigB (HAD superfamily)